MARGDLTGFERFADNAEFFLNIAAAAPLSTRDIEPPFRHGGSDRTLKLALRCGP